MPKDHPTRNPALSPAGLSRRELARHRSRPPGGLPAPVDQGDSANHCRFVTSQGGVQHCTDPTHLEGFCRFHHDCLLRGEISRLGRILDGVREGARRREINSHGMPAPGGDRLMEDPLTGEVGRELP